MTRAAGTRLVALLVMAAIACGIPVSGAAITSNPISVDFGSVPINTQATQPIDITVDTGYQVAIASGGLNPPFGFAFDTCGAGGGFTGPGNCSVAESFLPTSVGSSSDTLNVFECPTAGGSCLSVGISLFGTGISLLAANPASVDFGSVPINTQVILPINIIVDTGYQVSIASGGLNPPFGFAFDTCGAGGGFTGPGNCSVAESFLPTSVGSSSDTLNVFECPTAGGSCLSVGISLFGTGISLLAANPASVDFGEVLLNTTVTHAIDITVDTGYQVSIASGGLNPPFGFAFDACGAGGGFTGPGSCSVAESFLPTSLGSSSDTLNVFECPTAGGSCLSVGIPLSGTGIAVPEPSSLVLLGLGGLSGWLIRRRAVHNRCCPKRGCA